MRHRVARFRWPVAAAVCVLVVGSGTAYAVTRDGSTGHYRTVRAAKGDVEQVLSTTGTVDAAHRADLEFGASGTVAAVTVAVGDTVRAGQVVARLDTQALRAAVTRARAGVARALAQLETDENAQQQTVSDATSGAQPSKPTKPTKPTQPAGSSPSGSAGGVTSAALQELKQQQAAVVQAQSAATAAIAAAKDALAAQTTACASAYQDAPPSPSADPTAADSATKTASPADAACSAALTEVQARQTDVSTAQAALQQALDTLATTLGKALATLSGDTTTPAAARTAASRAVAPSAATTTTPATSNTTPAASSGTVSAARLAADQASIEKARADLVDARQQLRQAVLRSTRSGRVVSVPATKGAAVSAGDVGAVVVGGRAVTVVAVVPESRIAQVKAGEPVRVTTPGQSGSAHGTVTAIGLVADSSSGTPSYPVTVSVEDPTISLPAGSQALLAIVVATAKDVVTVPTSAVSRRGDSATVRTWDGTNLTRKTVTVGTVGARQVEITGGLAPGDEVVLADIDQAITGASDSVNDRGGFSGPVNFKGGGPGGPPVTFRSAK